MSDVSALHAAMRYCRRQHPQLRVSQLELILSVFQKPGQTQSELALECDLSLSAVSKAVDVLGSTGRRDKLSAARLGWLETKRNPDDDRVQQVYLTTTGVDFVTLLMRIIHGSPVSI